MGEALGPLETLPDESREASATNSNRDLPNPLEGTTLGISGRHKILQRIGESERAASEKVWN